MKLYWIFLILSVVCSLSSAQIDKIFMGKGKLRKVLLVFSGGLFLVCLIPLLAKIMG